MSCRRRGRAQIQWTSSAMPSPQRYEDAMRALLEDAATDALLVMNCPTALASSDAAASVVARETAAHKRSYPRKVVLTSWLGDGASSGQPAGCSPKRTSRPLRLPRRRSRGSCSSFDIARAQDELMQVPPSSQRSHVLRYGGGERHPARRAGCGAHHAIGSRGQGAAGKPRHSRRADADSCRSGQGRGNGRRWILKDHKSCVVKVLSDDISHKSDVGGVRLALASAREARVAAEEILSTVRKLRPSAIIRGFAVQPMAERSDAHELIIGASEDATVGPLMMFGAGGTSVEVTADTAHALPPLDLKLARQMMRETRIYRLLEGYRDRPAADIEPSPHALVRLSYLVANHEEIREIDINPLLADEQGVVAVDARVRVADPAAKRAWRWRAPIPGRMGGRRPPRWRGQLHLAPRPARR